MWPGPRSTSVSSGILTHAVISPQQTWAEKWGVLCPFLGELNPHLTQGLPLYQMVSSSIQRFGHNRHGPKIGGCAPLRGAGSPCNTMSPGPMSTSLSSGILIHPAVWPQQTRAENGGWGGVPLFKGELGPHVTQCGLGQGLPQYQVAS